MFEIRKKDFLNKKDKSRKGSIDAGIIPIVNLLNSSSSYYTTSSCAGRIMLLKIPHSGKKHETEWLFVKHGIVELSEINVILSNIPDGNLWFRQEGAILHVCCKTMQSAEKLLSVARDVSFKRSGIIAKGKRIIVEILGTEKLDAPIAKNGKLLVCLLYTSPSPRD